MMKQFISSVLLLMTLDLCKAQKKVNIIIGTNDKK